MGLKKRDARVSGELRPGSPPSYVEPEFQGGPSSVPLTLATLQKHLGGFQTTDAQACPGDGLCWSEIGSGMRVLTVSPGNSSVVLGLGPAAFPQFGREVNYSPMWPFL